MEECHLPGLGVALTLDHTKNESSEDGVSDLVCFVSGLLLGTNGKVRTWFGTFIRNGQQVSAFDMRTDIVKKKNWTNKAGLEPNQPLAIKQFIY